MVVSECVELIKHRVDRRGNAPKGKSAKLDFNICFLFPGGGAAGGGERAFFEKNLRFDSDRVNVRFFGIRPELHIGDAARGRTVYQPLPNNILLDVLVAFDCLHFLTAARLLELVKDHVHSNRTVLFGNIRPVEAVSPGFYLESWLVDKLAWVPSENPSEEDGGKGEWVATGDRRIEGGFGFIEGEPPMLNFAAGRLDNAYPGPTGAEWLQQRYSAGERGGIELHVHRSLLGQVLLRGAFLFGKVEDVPRQAPLTSGFVLVSGGVCMSALQRACIRADRTTCEISKSVENLRNVTRTAV